MELKDFGVCSEVESVHQRHKCETARLLAAEFAVLDGTECNPACAVTCKVFGFPDGNVFQENRVTWIDVPCLVGRDEVSSEFLVDCYTR